MIAPRICVSVTSDDFTPHQIAKELGGAHDVFSVLEGDRVVRHINGGLRVVPERRRLSRQSVRDRDRVGTSAFDYPYLPYTYTEYPDTWLSPSFLK